MDAVTATETDGLRERKRRATMDAIERGAVELALERGYENVTVEMICDLANISQRTFFNYAGSKERAVLGVDPPSPDDTLRSNYVVGGGGSPLEGLIGLIVSMFTDQRDGSTELFQMRHEIILANPELAIRQFAHLEEMQARLVQLVGQRLRTTSPGRDAEDVDDEARVTVSVALGVMHSSLHHWTATGFPDDFEAALRNDVAVARRVITATS